MTTYKANGNDAKTLTAAAAILKAANAQLAAAAKAADAAKDAIVKWLADNRGVTLDSLAIGDIINIDGIVMIEKAKQNKFDEKAFSLANPVTYLANKRDFPINRFKPLVG